MSVKLNELKRKLLLDQKTLLIEYEKARIQLAEQCRQEKRAMASTVSLTISHPNYIKDLYSEVGRKLIKSTEKSFYIYRDGYRSYEICSRSISVRFSIHHLGFV